MIKLYFFHYDGQILTDYFETEEAAQRWADQRGLEVFKIESVSKAEYDKVIKNITLKWGVK